MAAAYFSLVFLLSHLVILHSADEMSHHPNCPPFSCGKSKSIGFPFYNGTHPECGLFAIYNCTEDAPWIYLGPEIWYAVNKIDQDNTTSTIQISHLQQFSCDSLYDLSLPHSSYYSFTIEPNITLFKCYGDVTLPSDFSYTYCNDAFKFNIYYNGTPPDHGTQLSVPPQCSIIQLPSKTNTPINDHIFSLLTDEFSLKLRVSEECFSCHRKGGQCLSDWKGELECVVDAESGNKTRWLKLALGICGGIILIISFVAVVLWCRYKRKYAWKLLSRNISSEPNSKSYQESGNVFFGVPIFSYNELEEATNNFDSNKELGDGGFGTVYYGILRDGREVAVKRLYESNYKRVEQFMNEIEILTRMRHKNLVTLYGCTSRHSRELLLVYEYIPNGTVADHLHGDRATPGSFTWPIRMSIAIETASALAYLHASDIIHRDVKTNNILLDNHFCVKVADFGLSRLFPFDVTHVTTAPQGTPGYLDPEYRQCYQLTDKSDVYSFGVVLIELISSLPAVDITRHRHEINLANLAIDRILNRAYDELIDPSLGFESDSSIKRMTTAVAELAFLCLQSDKEMRPSMDEVVETLKRIESTGAIKHEAEVIEEVGDHVGVLNSVRPPPSPESDKAV